MARRIASFGCAAPSKARRAAWWLLVIAVALVHGWVAEGMRKSLADAHRSEALPARIEVAYVRELEPTKPPPAAAPQAPTAIAQPAQRAPRARPAKIASAPAVPAASSPAAVAERPPRDEAPLVAAAEAPASAPDEAAPAALALPDATLSAADPAASAASSAAAEAAAQAVASAPLSGEAEASVAAGAASPASAPGGFDWPVSTRVTFILTGNYRGDVNGDAQVEWVRVGSRYQVHVDLSVGPSFAPVISRRMTSDGEISAAGLVPRRYDQETKVVLRDRHLATVRFDADQVVLAKGQRVATMAGVQDTASQFIQLTYLFSTQPGLLAVGKSIDIPLALPHRVEVWTYDVLAEETLQTPFGPVATFHLKPRRANPRIGELTAEIWFAPELRYLPVRIRVEQDPQTYIDMVIARRPELAG